MHRIIYFSIYSIRNIQCSNPFWAVEVCKNRHNWKVFMNEILEGWKYAEDTVVVFKHVNGDIRSVKVIRYSTDLMFRCVCEYYPMEYWFIFL